MDYFRFLTIGTFYGKNVTLFLFLFLSLSFHLFSSSYHCNHLKTRREERDRTKGIETVWCFLPVFPASNGIIFSTQILSSFNSYFLFEDFSSFFISCTSIFFLILLIFLINVSYPPSHHTDFSFFTFLYYFFSFSLLRKLLFQESFSFFFKFLSRYHSWEFYFQGFKSVIYSFWWLLWYFFSFFFQTIVWPCQSNLVHSSSCPVFFLSQLFLSFFHFIFLIILSFYSK